MKNENNKYWIWFSRIQKLTCIQKERLLKIYNTPEEIWKLSREKLNKLDCIDSACIDEILNRKYRQNIEIFEKYINSNNIKIITIQDEEYPVNLKNIYDKPIILFAKGNLNLLNNKSVSIVGCRNCSLYGKNVAKKLAYALAKNNFTIISGLAKGIDKNAHIGALEASGNTIAVIGNGLDNVYPYENKELAEQIVKNNGLIITEYIVGTKPEKMNFPARNRIISALSQGIIVVEAKEKSGALITVDFGLEQGKEIFAVPGNINSINSKGTNELIKQGANIITSHEDVINLLK